MKILKFLTVLAFAAILASDASAKKMYLLNFDKGDMPSNGLAGTLSEDNAPKKDGLMFKAVIPADSKGDSFFGEWGTKRSNWADYEYLRFTVFNPQKEIVKITVTIGDNESRKKWGFQNRFAQSMVCKPGASPQEMSIQGISTNGGRPLDLKTINVWNITITPLAGAETTLFFGNIVLENEGEGAADKEKDDKVKKDSVKKDDKKDDKK